MLPISQPELQKAIEDFKKLPPETQDAFLQVVFRRVNQLLKPEPPKEAA